MSKIVSKNNSDSHIIKPYKFKELDSENKEEVSKVSFEEIKENSKPQPNLKEDKNCSENKELIERLLSKIEEMSEYIINIQNTFQTQLNECKNQIEIGKKRAFEEGYKKGFEEANQNAKTFLNEKIELLEKSIEKIDKVNDIFEEKIVSIEKELISVALDIAKEVIQKEISENSKEIAYNLAKSLMDEVKEATKIKIKVNPKDAKYLKSRDFKNVEIIEDEAVKEGGVVIISDIGNIDGEILSRFKAIKEAILEERSSED